MSKTYKGYELIKAIADGEIKDNQKFDVLSKDGYLWIKNATIKDIGMTELLNFNFELIEDNTIDIDSIEKLEIISEYVKRPDEFGMGHIEYKAKEPRLIGLVTNELIRAVKQLNKEIKDLKER